MCIVEQVEKVIEDMKQLHEDLINSDVDVIDIEQLKQLAKFSKGYSSDIQNLIYELKELE